jgi:hypothetical protein
LVNGEKVLSSEDNVLTTGKYGTPVHNNVIVDTYNAMGIVNGKQILANPMEVAYIQSHIQTLRSTVQAVHHHQSTGDSTIDLRKQIRHVEDLLLSRHVDI